MAAIDPIKEVLDQRRAEVTALLAHIGEELAAHRQALLTLGDAAREALRELEKESVYAALFHFFRVVAAHEYSVLRTALKGPEQQPLVDLLLQLIPDGSTPGPEFVRETLSKIITQSSVVHSGNTD